MKGIRRVHGDSRLAVGCGTLRISCWRLNAAMFDTAGYFTQRRHPAAPVSCLPRGTPSARPDGQHRLSASEHPPLPGKGGVCGAHGLCRWCSTPQPSHGRYHVKMLCAQQRPGWEPRRFCPRCSKTPAASFRCPRGDGASLPSDTTRRL